MCGETETEPRLRVSVCVYVNVCVYVCVRVHGTHGEWSWRPPDWYRSDSVSGTGLVDEARGRGNPPFTIIIWKLSKSMKNVLGTIIIKI